MTKNASKLLCMCTYFRLHKGHLRDLNSVWKVYLYTFVNVINKYRGNLGQYDNKEAELSERWPHNAPYI